MDPTTARSVLTGLDDLRGRVRQRANVFWLPQCCFGVLMLAVAPVGVLAGRQALYLGLFAASVAGAVASTVLSSRYERTRGVVRRSRAYVATAVGGIALCIAVSVLVPARPADVPPWIAVTGIYLVFAWLERDPVVALLGLAFGLVAVGFAVGFPGGFPGAVVTPPGVLTGVEGALMLATGIALRGYGSRRDAR